jgi:hypothetical protein
VCAGCPSRDSRDEPGSCRPRGRRRRRHHALRQASRVRRL